MSDLFLNKFRTNSNRLKGHDYSGPGVYFITILTDAKISFFGKIVQGKMHLSPVGIIVLTNWLSLPERFAAISLDEFVIMPDHLHGILIISKNNNSLKMENNNSVTQKEIFQLFTDNHHCKDAIYRVSIDSSINQTENSGIKQSNLQKQETRGGITKNHNPMISKDSLSYYLRWFKGKSTYQIRKAFPKIRFSWHPGYYDTNIKDKKSFFAAKKYIRNNPIKWGS